MYLLTIYCASDTLLGFEDTEIEYQIMPLSSFILVGETEKQTLKLCSPSLMTGRILRNPSLGDFSREHQRVHVHKPKLDTLLHPRLHGKTY